MRIVTLFALIAIFFAGCGFKGPLYLPGAKPAPAGASVPAQQP
jgi:predicted small lipoprotein YifL